MVYKKATFFISKLFFGLTYESQNHAYDMIWFISEQNEVPKSMTRSSVRKSLKVVNLAGNDIEKIDSKFWLNTNLEEVNLSENKEIILKY